MFTPQDNRNGESVFEVVAIDDGPTSGTQDNNTSAPLRFTVRVTPVNDPPSFVNDPAGITVTEGTPEALNFSRPFASQISPGPFEPEQGVVFTVQVPAADRPLFTTLPTIDPATGVLSFQLTEDAAGETTLTIFATDTANPGLSTSLRQIPLTIVNVPDRPTFNNQNDTLATNEDTVITTSETFILTNVTEVDPLDRVVFLSVDTTSMMGATITRNADGSIVYDPRGAAMLQALDGTEPPVTDSFTYTINEENDTDTPEIGTIFVTVGGVNDAPTVVDDTITIAGSGNTRLDPQPLDNDLDVDNMLVRSTFVITRQPTGGTLSEDNGSLVYRPGPNFQGTDTFQYAISDELGLQSRSATVTLIAAPSLGGGGVIEAGSAVGRPTRITLEDFIDSPQPLDLSSLQPVMQAANGTFVVSGGQLVFQPNDGFIGTDTFSFTIADTAGNRSPAISVNVNIVGAFLQNPVSPSDVNRNGVVSALDALLIINRLNAADANSIDVTDADFGIGAAPNGEREQFFYDVDGNGRISALDALRVINALNQQDLPGSEPGVAVPVASRSVFDLLAADQSPRGTDLDDDDDRMDEALGQLF